VRDVGRGSLKRSIFWALPISARDHASGLLRERAQDGQEAHASQAQGFQDGVGQTYAPPVAQTGACAVSGNRPSMWWFCNQVRWLWLKTLRRRIQKGDLAWKRFISLVDRFFSANQDIKLAALSELQRQCPREEPSALAAPAGIWERARSNPRP
jgi:hypothetical protein